MKTEKEIADMKLADAANLTLQYGLRTAKVMLENKPLFTIMFGIGNWINAKDDVVVCFNAAESPEWEIVDSRQLQGSLNFRIMKKVIK